MQWPQIDGSADDVEHKPLWPREQSTIRSDVA